MSISMQLHPIHMGQNTLTLCDGTALNAMCRTECLLAGLVAGNAQPALRVLADFSSTDCKVEKPQGPSERTSTSLGFFLLVLDFLPLNARQVCSDHAQNPNSFTKD